ncbi:hypothetical protein [Chitinophaga caseinilytica]|uniref:Uncharacterized protein n=1 Tax=Chitinophaga caseinilytica TaxID=2267521 RepID=A0ABZ2Z5Z4_9BACT
MADLHFPGLEFFLMGGGKVCRIGGRSGPKRGKKRKLQADKRFQTAKLTIT